MSYFSYAGTDINVGDSVTYDDRFAVIKSVSDAGTDTDPNRKYVTVGTIDPFGSIISRSFFTDELTPDRLKIGACSQVDAAIMLSHLMRRGAQLEKQSQDNYANWQKAHDDLEAFKGRVVEVAYEYGERYSFCEQLEAALEELGIDTEIDVVVSGTFSTSVRVSRRALRDHSAVDTDDILASLNGYDIDVDSVVTD